MDGRKGRETQGPFGFEPFQERCVNAAGKDRVGKFPFSREGVVLQPGQEFFIEAEAAVDILRGMDVQVDKGRDDDVLAVVNDFFRPRRFGQGRREARYDAVFDMGILIFADRQFRPRRRIEKISFKEHVNVTFFLCLRRYVNG